VATDSGRRLAKGRVIGTGRELATSNRKLAALQPPMGAPPNLRGMDQHLGNTPPDVKMNLPAGVTVAWQQSAGLTSGRWSMRPGDPLTVEAWGCNERPPPYRAPDPDLERWYLMPDSLMALGFLQNLTGGFNEAFTPTAGGEPAPRAGYVEYQRI